MPFIHGCYFSQVISHNSNFEPPLPSMIKSIIKEVLDEGGQGDPEVFTILSAHHKHNNPLCLFLYMAAPRLEWTRMPCSHVASVSINVVLGMRVTSCSHHWSRLIESMPSPARLLLSVGRIVELSEGWVVLCQSAWRELPPPERASGSQDWLQHNGSLYRAFYGCVSLSALDVE